MGRSSRSASTSSVHIPADLPQVVANEDGGADNVQDREAQWEKRATILAQGNINVGGGRRRPSSSLGVSPESQLYQQQRSRSRSSSAGRVSDRQGDVGFLNIRSFIRDLDLSSTFLMPCSTIYVYSSNLCITAGGHPTSHSIT